MRGAANYWDIVATFVFGDDFSGDLSKWTFSDTYGSGGSASIVAGERLRIVTVGGNTHAGVSNATFSTGIMEADLEVNHDNNYQLGGAGFGDSTSNFLMPARRHISSNVVRAEWDIGGGAQDAGSIAAAWTTWYAKVILTGSIGKMYGKELKTDLWTAFKEDLSFSSNVPIRLKSYDDAAAGDGFLYVDNVRVRKYAANPPTYAFGAEQSAPTGGTRLPRIFTGPFMGPLGGPIQ